MLKNQRTHGESVYTNRLIHETSPYLLQHAHNPVDWYPWSEEALARARTEDKPILISIGYAACHWCHVMEHESFEDPAIATIQNEHFVNIKVDREERPDLDSIYMSAVQAMTGQGGWPLNCFLLPDGTPFYGGTYFPPDEKATRYRMPSWKQVLLSIAEAYRNRRDELRQAGAELLGHLQQIHAAPAGGSFDLAQLSEVLDTAFNALASNFDERNGGFGGAPKFPQPMTLEFLLRYHVRAGSDEALRMLEHTLRRMALGGIYDQLGGGFHRYSVDDHWLVPHFEKMLYDNALLARMYVEAYQISGDDFYKRIAEETLTYMAREMLHPAGGFYSTQDADSLAPDGHKHEGEFFVWTPEQVRSVLGEDAALFCTVFDVSRQGNFEGRNILNLPRPLDEITRVTGVPVARLEEVLKRGREKLFASRERRIKPDRDEKVLTAWNGMALRAFSAAATAFGNNEYLTVAQRNADFLLRELRRADGRVMRSWKDGAQAPVLGFLEDYALLADGLLALYQADGDPRWLRECLTTTDVMLDLFWDHGLGGFYDTARDQEALVTRPRDVGDNATPSGNSTATEVLLRLAALTGNDAYRARAEQIIAGLTDVLTRFPAGFGRLLCAVDFALAPVKEVALIGDPASADMQALMAVVQRPYRPYVVVAYGFAGDWRLAIGDSAEQNLQLLQGREMIDGKATAYVCEKFVCKLPCSDPTTLSEQLAS